MSFRFNGILFECVEQMSKEFNITLLPGDGTGPEVVNEAVKVLENTSEQYKIKFNLQTMILVEIDI